MPTNEGNALKNSGELPCCNKKRYEISTKDLPLSCPPRDTRVWDGHPRVYLPIQEVGEVVCPYCGAAYILSDFIPPEKPLIVK